MISPFSTEKIVLSSGVTQPERSLPLKRCCGLPVSCLAAKRDRPISYDPTRPKAKTKAGKKRGAVFMISVFLPGGNGPARVEGCRPLLGRSLVLHTERGCPMIVPRQDRRVNAARRPSGKH